MVTMGNSLSQLSRLLRDFPRELSFVVEPPPKTVINHTFEKRFCGLDIVIENERGTTRGGVNDDGTEWSTTMLYDYGYIKSTSGVDGEGIDVYLGPDEGAEYAYVVHQNNPKTNKYDEDKVMLGFQSTEDARAAYMLHYDDPKYCGSITAIPMDKFHEAIRWRRKKRYTKGFLTGVDFSVDPSEFCYYCGARMEMGDDGKCNRCRKPFRGPGGDLFDADFEKLHPRKKDGEFAPKGKGESRSGKSASPQSDAAHAKTLKTLASKASKLGNKITKPGHAWDIYNEWKSSSAARSLSKPDPALKKSEPKPGTAKTVAYKGKVYKAVYFDRNDPPDWLKEKLLSGEVPYFPPMATHLHAPVDPDKSGGVLYGYQYRLTQGRNKGKIAKPVVVDPKVAAESQFKKHNEKVAPLFQHLPEMVSASYKDIKEDDAAGPFFLAALCGIRADAADGKAYNVVDGKKIYTVGATTLQARHIKIASDRLVKLEFPGKKGKLNTRLITNDSSLSHDEARKTIRKLINKSKLTKEEAGQLRRAETVLSKNVIYSPEAYELLTKKKRELGDRAVPLFNTSYAESFGVGSYLAWWRDKHKHEFNAHNFRHAFATQRFNDLIDLEIVKLRGKRLSSREYRKTINRVMDIAADSINDTRGAAKKSYLNGFSESMESLRKRVDLQEGEEWAPNGIDILKTAKKEAPLKVLTKKYGKKS